jgi:N-acetyltransferase
MLLTHEILENRFVRLEPLAEAHKEDLRAACAADPDLWRDLYIYSMLGDEFDGQWSRVQAETESGQTLAYAVVVEGVCRGMTTYLAPDPVHHTVEIGATYYDPAVRGGPVNPACKRLLLAHAFACGATRVQFRVDAINARSRAAVAKLGAVFEGVLRQDRVTWTGRVRDTSYYSILTDEWPAVRDRLDARLAAFG